jgi:hypothetical protein
VLINNRRDDQFETKIDLAFRPTFSFLVKERLLCFKTPRRFEDDGGHRRFVKLASSLPPDGKVQVLLMTLTRYGR